MNKNVLITGATSGIGIAYAKRFAQKGYDLIITGRRENKIQQVAKEISNTYQVNVEVILGELSNHDEVDALIQKIQSKRIDVLINNAGFGLNNMYCEEGIANWEKMLEVHVRCPMRLIHAILPNMIKNGEGIIINVSSISAVLFMPKNSIYSATKSFLKVFSECLQMEVMGTGVKVQTLCPSFTRTDFHEKMGMDKCRQGNKGLKYWKTPEEVVDYSLDYLSKNKVVCIPGWETKFMIKFFNLIPNKLYAKIVGNTIKKSK